MCANHVQKLLKARRRPFSHCRRVQSPSFEAAVFPKRRSILCAQSLLCDKRHWSWYVFYATLDSAWMDFCHSLDLLACKKHRAGPTLKLGLTRAAQRAQKAPVLRRVSSAFVYFFALLHAQNNFTRQLGFRDQLRSRMCFGRAILGGGTLRFRPLKGGGADVCVYPVLFPHGTWNLICGQNVAAAAFTAGSAKFDHLGENITRTAAVNASPAKQTNIFAAVAAYISVVIARWRLKIIALLCGAPAVRIRAKDLQWRSN